MSRGIKDLRELICVSRLTVRESDEDEYYSSDESIKTAHDRDLEDEQTLNNRLDNLSVSSSDESRLGSAGSSNHNRGNNSSDSGLGNGKHGDSQGAFAPKPPSSDTGKLARRKRKKKRKAVQAFLSKHDLPTSAPLPPVRNNSDLSTESFDQEGSTPSKTRRSNFDDMMVYMDAAVVSGWLQQANEIVSELSQWCSDTENFVNFTHFWLTDFPDIQRMEIFKLEFGILLDHLQLAFVSGYKSGKVKHRDFVQLLDAILREYPGKMYSSKGSHMFLDYLDILTSEKQDRYKKLLSDVKCSTRIKQYAQLMLATRSFALVSMWSAIVNFYRSLLGKGNTIGGTFPAQKGSRYEQFMYQSIRNGYLDVIHYLLVSEKIHPRDQDHHGRSLIFTAVMHNQPKVIEFLAKQVKPRPDVNAPADTGNTPLHAAANNGNVVLVIELLKTDGIDVNVQNHQCEDATPLHLAVMHGHGNVVEVLLCAKADVHAKMGDLSAIDIARDFGHKSIHEMIMMHTGTSS